MNLGECCTNYAANASSIVMQHTAQTQNKNKGDNERIWIVFSHKMLTNFLVMSVCYLFSSKETTFQITKKS